ncbi:P-loop containing nucleoside triphosphate hydrolase protein [Hypoxylon sp. NC1633]|nr:P-loop containing nucleoside triphosphate hydrolase protein [Hypoxylon sp. NC1633]
MPLLEGQDMDEDFDHATRDIKDVKHLFHGMNVKALGLRDPKNHIPFNFLFRGTPGTGKTTTARKMGNVFYDLGFLATTEIIEIRRHTGPKTRALFEKALGKVLFIDEAYRLASTSDSRSFASEAVGELVDILTQDRFRNNLVVVLAGYEEDINRLLATNPGLSSRFPETVNFENLTPALYCELLFRSIHLDTSNIR